MSTSGSVETGSLWLQQGELKTQIDYQGWLYKMGVSSLLLQPAVFVWLGLFRVPQCCVLLV